MGKGKKTNQETEKIIYLLLSPFEKKFFIGHCNKNSLRETYRHNLKGRRELTKKFISQIEPERPCLFILEEFLGDINKTKSLIIVWTKIFLENGYESYNQPGLIEMTEHLYIGTNTLYEERKNYDLKEITSCTNCALPKFNHEICEKYPLEVVSTEKQKRPYKKTVRFSFTDEEYEKISGLAHANNMQVNPYIQKVALNPRIIQVDFSAINMHSKEIAEVRNAINRLVFTIDATNNYLPKEIESIVNMMNAIFQGENELLKTIRESLDRLEK